ncbi:MAG: winged helix-turn-helix domain-containing protein [Thermoproteota archaeon]|nr:winged helix-turn-helix domain-containing protein [Thermoproteota archaeon]
MILQAVEEEPLTRSKIKYQAMLNFKQATDYTAFLIQEGLLRYLMLDRRYAITDIGRQFLALLYETNKKLLVAPDGNTQAIIFKCKTNNIRR